MDNGAEVASPTNKAGHPMERMFQERHAFYTRPYRPQTNGKIERFWRTLNEDLLDETTFESVEELQRELQAREPMPLALRHGGGGGSRQPRASRLEGMGRENGLGTHHSRWRRTHGLHLTQGPCAVARVRQ